LLLAACGDGSRGDTAGALSSMVLNRGNSAEPKSLDPAYFDEIWSFQIAGDLLMGLTTENAEGKPIPGAAERWEASPDGRVWTFHLRDHLWSDGMPVTAEDFVFAWRRVLDPKTPAPYASYLYPIVYAREVNGGTMPPDALGVAAPDKKTVVVTFANPIPFVAEFMTHHTLYPVPRHVVAEKGDAWSRPGNYASNGAYVLKEWVANDHITLSKNPRFYDAANVKIETVNYYPTQDADAGLRRLRAGELDTQDPIPPLQIDFLRANLPAALKVQPSLSIYYVSINVTKPPFNDIRIREALNLAYDRETIVEKILKLGELPAYGMVPAPTANYPGGAALRFKAMAPEQRLMRAQALMRAAGYGRDRMLHAKLSATTAATTKQTLAPIQEMWKKIYVDVEIIQSDTPANYQKLEQADFELGTAVWVADFNDASNFLEVLRTGGGNNYGRYSNPKYDAALDRAARERDLQRRGEMLATAEQTMLDDYPLVFSRFGVTTAVVQPYVKGWIANVKEMNRTRWLSLDR
jgi:oligopeptide transport system substrate-binding protein